MTFNPFLLALISSQHDLSIKLEANRDDIANTALESVARRHVEQPSLTGRSTVPMNDPIYRSMPGYYGSHHAGPIPHHGGHAPPPNHNQVDILRIRLGLDVRTTVSCPFAMLFPR